MNNDIPLISIIVPVYNVEPYLNRCVNSILAQTYKNIEIILVDDGSPDNCPKMCDNWASKDSRIKVIHKVNGGLSDARNAGINIAKGDYLAFVDSDDWVSIDFCLKTYEYVTREDADLAVFGYWEVDENGQISLSGGSFPTGVITKSDAMFGLASGQIENYAWNKIYRKRLFCDVQYPSGRLWEDIGTTYRLFENARKLYITDEPLYYYFQRPTSITRNSSPKAYLDIFEQREQEYRFFRTNYPNAATECIPLLVASALQVCIYFCNDDQHFDTYQNAKRFIEEHRNDQSGIDNKHKFLLNLLLYAYPLFVYVCKIFGRGK